MIRLSIITAAFVLVAGAAIADPCDAPVSGYRAGQVIEGPVIYSGDGDSLCVALGRTPDRWVEIREADWFAPELNERGGREAKAVMDRLVGRHAVCTVERGQSNGKTYSFDRVIASCKVEGKSIRDIMHDSKIKEGGRGYEERR